MSFLTVRLSISCHSLIDKALATLKEKAKAERDTHVPETDQVWSNYLSRKADYLAFRKLQDSTGICRRLMQQLSDEADERASAHKAATAAAAAAAAAARDPAKVQRAKMGRWKSEGSLCSASHAMVSAGCNSPARVELLESGDVQVFVSLSVSFLVPTLARYGA